MTGQVEAKKVTVSLKAVRLLCVRKNILEVYTVVLSLAKDKLWRWILCVSVKHKYQIVIKEVLGFL